MNHVFRPCGCELRSGIRHLYRQEPDKIQPLINEVLRIEQITDPAKQAAEHMLFEERNILPRVSTLVARRITAEHQRFRMFLSRGQMPPDAEWRAHSMFERTAFVQGS